VPLLCFALLVPAFANAKPDSVTATDAFLELMSLWKVSPESLADLIRKSDLAAIAQLPNVTAFDNTEKPRATSEYPLVFAHGMGDSCFNPGMSQITDLSAKRAGVYGVCIPTGNNLATDTMNGFFMDMDKNVEIFTEKVRADPKLANGFHAIGFSQGNSILRGYIQKYNDPPVNTVIHVHGTVSGVAGFPQCNPSGIFCKLLANLCGDFVYNSIAQKGLFQADYFRDPNKIESGYKKYSQLAVWNNEGENGVNKTISENFLKTQKFVMVKALEDTMVFPNEGEWWGHFKDGSHTEILTMKETEWYKKDLFGLRTADLDGRIIFETTPGNHLKFTEEELFGWIDKYILSKANE